MTSERRRFAYRHVGAAVLGMFVVGTVLLGELGRVGTEPGFDRTAALAAASLSDDDEGQALFTTAELVPGSVVTNCLRVDYGGPETAASVRLAAFDLAGPLASALTVRVWQGTGGAYGDCAGFAGTAVYDGPLTALASGAPAAPASAGVDTSWNPGPADARTYQITVTVAPGAAQGSWCTATLRWLLVDTSPAGTSSPAASPSPAHSPSPAASPAPAPGPVENPAPTEHPVPAQPVPGNPIGKPPVVTEPKPTATPRTTASPVPDGSAQPPASGPGGVVELGQDGQSGPAGAGSDGGAPGGSNGRGASPRANIIVRQPKAGKGSVANAANPLELAKNVGEMAFNVSSDVVAVAKLTSRHSGVIGGWLVLLVAFVAIQNRIDSRDPKLAMAPLVSEPFLYFADGDATVDGERENGADQARRSG